MTTETKPCRECGEPTAIPVGREHLSRACPACFKRFHEAKRAEIETAFRDLSEELRKSRAVRVVIDHLAQTVTAVEDLFAGRPSFVVEHVAGRPAAPESATPLPAVAPPPIDDADGTLTVALAGREPVALDLFVADDAFRAALDGWRFEKDGTPGQKAECMADYYRRTAAAAEALGFPGVTGTTAERIRQTVSARMEELRKKAAAGSPAPTP